MRQARDGMWYTKEQFLEYYAERAAAMWNEANPRGAAEPAEEPTAQDCTESRTVMDARPTLAPSPPSEHQLGIAGASAAAVLGPCVRLAADDGAHLAEPLPAQAAAVPEAAQPAEQQPPIVFTQEQLRSMATPHNLGGKVASEKQRELRERLLPTDERETDLTFSEFEWRSVLKSLPSARGADIVGAGVCKFTFRLLPDVFDHNYVKLDSGERHVFEVSCADGSSVHLHYHKNGKCDVEKFRRPLVEIGAAEPDRAKARLELTTPVTFDDIVHSELPGKNLPMGRSEATMALETLLHVTRHGIQIHAVNITDGIAFSWKRLLRNTVRNREIIAGGISAVYAVRKPNEADGPQLFFCHPDSTYTRVFIRQESTQHQHSRAGRWQDLPDLQNAIHIDRSWMNIRANAGRSCDPPSPRGPDRGDSKNSGGGANSRLGCSSRGGDGPGNAGGGVQSAAAQQVPPPSDPLGPLQEC